MNRIVVALFSLAIILIAASIVVTILASVPESGTKTLLTVGLSAAGIIVMILTIVYTLKRK
jgi:hypothetical protein